jgi:hypothetical protein
LGQSLEQRGTQPWLIRGGNQSQGSVLDCARMEGATQGRGLLIFQSSRLTGKGEISSLSGRDHQPCLQRPGWSTCNWTVYHTAYRTNIPSGLVQSAVRNNGLSQLKSASTPRTGSPGQDPCRPGSDPLTPSAYDSSLAGFETTPLSLNQSRIRRFQACQGVCAAKSALPVHKTRKLGHCYSGLTA